MVGSWWLVVGGWLLAVVGGCWLLVVGGWLLLVVGGRLFVVGCCSCLLVVGRCFCYETIGREGTIPMRMWFRCGTVWERDV